MPDAQFFDGKSAAGLAVDAGLHGADLVIIGPDGNDIAVWPVMELRRTDIDAPDGIITLRRAGGPERLMLSDPTVLSDLRAAGVKLGVSAKRWPGRAWVGVVAGIVGGVALTALFIDQFPALAAPLVPDSITRGWSSGIQAAVVGQDRVCAEASGRRVLSELITTLASAADLGRPPSFIVIDRTQVNAFTLPDGRMVILRGLIDNVADPDEFAGVVAHELGHASRHDPTRQMIRGLTLRLIAQSFGMDLGVAADITTLSYGRGAESAADASAVQTLQRAGLRADGLGRFLSRLDIDDSPSALAQILSDHPGSAGRAAALHVPSGGRSALSADDWARVKAICSR